MLKIGIVGIGGIAQKAYLPYLRQLAGIEWHLFTRNQDTLQQVAASLAHSRTYSRLEELVAADLDGVMIHVATPAHFETARLFLEKGVPVYMDKPLTEDYPETVALYHLAQEQQTFLMAGFNRRFAPKVSTLKEQTDKRRIFVEKNEANHKGDLIYKLFDIFIHPLDTALFLADEEPTCGYFSYHLEEGELSQVMVTLETRHSSIVASMNLQSGSRREIMEVQTPQASYQLKNLDDLTIFEGQKETKVGFDSWATTLYKRGFETIVEAFLKAIQTGEAPVSPSSSLLSHWICQQIQEAKTKTGQLVLDLPEWEESNHGTQTTKVRR